MPSARALSFEGTPREQLKAVRVAVAQASTAPERARVVAAVAATQDQPLWECGIAFPVE